MMEHIIEQLITSQNCQLQEAIFLENVDFDYWHSTVIDNKGNPLAGGFANDQMQARKIAISEFIERSTYRRIRQSGFSENEKWGIDLIPTACGFAAGFNKHNTIQRSITEAVERWVMSKWIDDGYYIQQKSINEIGPLDPASLFFISQFDEVLFFEKDVVLQVNQDFQTIKVAQTMGLTKEGIFPGSSAQITGGNIWQHSLLETFRHLLAVKNNPDMTTFPGNKVEFFSKNKNIALSRINSAQNKKWPIPEIKFHNVESFANDQYFIARTIINGWISWNEGPIDRFLY